MNHGSSNPSFAHALISGEPSFRRFADGHCDTILKVMENEAAFGAGPGFHVTLDGLAQAGVCAQVFACFVLERRCPGQARERGLQVVQAVRDLCASHPAQLRLVESRDDLPRTAGSPTEETAGSPAGTAVIIGLEGADPLEGDVEALRLFYDRGVRLLTLAWDDNQFCGTTFGGGGGLSLKGTHLVQLCEELGVVVDVSHASDMAFWDVCGLARKPFVASHSNCRAVCPAPRNLTDQMIRALAERGGVMGINLASGFLSPEVRELEKKINEDFWAAVRSERMTFDEAGDVAREAEAALPRPPLDWVMRHVRHAVNVGGEDAVALGGDLDGVDNLPQGVDGVGDYPRIAEMLEAGGLPSSQVEKICSANLLRVLGSN